MKEQAGDIRGEDMMGSVYAMLYGKGYMKRGEDCKRVEDEAERRTERRERNLMG